MSRYRDDKRRAAAAELGKRHPRMTLYGSAIAQFVALAGALVAVGVGLTWTVRHLNVSVALYAVGAVALILAVILWAVRRHSAVPRPPRGLR